MTVYLFDTNVLSQVLRVPEGRVAARISELDDDARCTSIVVAAELRFGAVKKGASDLHRRIEGLLQRLRVEPFGPPADTRYAELRVDLERKGHVIGSNDLLIAAHTLALGCTLVTDHVREFSRVPSLSVENWLR